MRIPTLALTLAAAAGVVALPTAANAAPTPTAPDSAQALFESSAQIDVLANDKALEENAGKTLSVTSATIDTLHGAVSCTTAGMCTYRPDRGWVGSETFTYSVSDGGAEPGQGTVTVNTINVGLIGQSVSTRRLRWPNTLDVTGFVKDPSGAFVQNVDVKLMARVSGGVYTQVGPTLNTGSTGKMAVTGLAPTETTTYKWMVENRSSSSSMVPVTPKLTAGWGDKKLAVGDTTTLNVTTAPVTAGEKVVLERQLSSGVWEPVPGFEQVFAETSTSDQAFTWTIPATNGSRTYRVSVPKSGGREATTSTDTTVKGYKAEIVNFEPSNADEWVKIQNTGKVSINLENWVVADGNSEVKLPNYSVGPGDSLKIHSGSGRNGFRNLYLRKTGRFWGDNSTFTLTDDTKWKMDVFPDPVTP
jgi:hypothetical protein